MSALEIIAITYAASVCLFLLSGSIVLLLGQNERDRKVGARQIFISPFAPLVLILLAIRGVSRLWLIADFKDKERR